MLIKMCSFWNTAVSQKLPLLELLKPKTGRVLVQVTVTFKVTVTLRCLARIRKSEMNMKVNHCLRK